VTLFAVIVKTDLNSDLVSL